MAVKNHWPGSPQFTKMVSAMFARRRSVLFLFQSAPNDHVQSLSANVPSSMNDESFIESFRESNLANAQAEEATVETSPPAPNVVGGKRRVPRHVEYQPVIF